MSFQFGERMLVVIIEMGTRREDLDGLESVRRDLDQVIPVEPDAVIEMCGNPELHGNQQV
jgi:hypothetical protein